MVTLNVTLGLEAIAKLHDILVCLSKFSDIVSIEARNETVRSDDRSLPLPLPLTCSQLTLSTLNSTKSGYASFAFDKSFFSRYTYEPTLSTSTSSATESRFTCSLLTRALLSVFKSRVLEVRNKETAIDHCDISVLDSPDETECRFIIKMVCTHGVTKTYRLTYESVEVMHALFDRASATNRWSIRAAYLREFVDFFAPKAEQLDVYCDAGEGKVTFLSFTEKIVNAKQGQLTVERFLTWSANEHIRSTEASAENVGRNRPE